MEPLLPGAPAVARGVPSEPKPVAAPSSEPLKSEVNGYVKMRTAIAPTANRIVKR